MARPTFTRSEHGSQITSSTLIIWLSGIDQSLSDMYNIDPQRVSSTARMQISETLPMLFRLFVGSPDVVDYPYLASVFMSAYSGDPDSMGIIYAPGSDMAGGIYVDLPDEGFPDFSLTWPSHVPFHAGGKHFGNRALVIQHIGACQ